MNHYSKFFTSLLLGAIAIVGCQREPKVEPNPNFNPETDEVNAAFIMSIATGSSTKMSAENVQQNTNFLGIHKAKILLYSDGEAQDGYWPFVKRNSGEAKQLYDLDEILTAGALNAANNATSSSNRVVELSIPLGADAALFYGKAINSSPGKVQGKMDFTHIDKNPANTYFAVTRRIGSETDVANYDATARLMIFALNTIITTAINPSTNYTNHLKTYPKEGPTLPALNWPDLGHQYELKIGTDPYTRPCTPWTRDLVPLEVILGQAYSRATVIKNGEFRAGSSNAVKNMMQDLYKVVSTVANADPTGDLEANAVRLAEQIITTMNIFFNDNWTYKSVTTIHDALITAGVLSQDAWDNATTGFAGSQDLNNYPYGDFGIPEGAAQLKFYPENGTTELVDRFEYLHPNRALVTPGREEFEPRKYIYPAELAYYVNSPLWVTSKADLVIGDYPNGTTPWKTTGTGTKWDTGGWSIDKVKTSTRGVAIRDNINYGVALMETRVAWSEAALTHGGEGGAIDDNRSAMTNGAEGDRTIPLADTHFILRGVLIGGVHPRYDWQFLPKNVTGNTEGLGTFDGVIYDDAIPNTAVPTPSDKPNYTLVYDNFDYSKVNEDDVQNDVYVALEFVNNGDAFWGRDNLIPSGGVFYLGAKLTTKGEHQSAQTLHWPTDHQIPPVYETGANRGQSKQIPRVFIQDFLTKATFRIGINSLKYAYFTVPDLRSSQMSFGLSVELSWESGYEYDIEFGNNPGPANP